MAGKILITPRGYARYGQEARKKLEAAGYELDINDTGKPLSRETFVEKLKESTGLIVGVEDCGADLLKECSHLKVIVKFGVGLDNIDQAACQELGIKVGRCVGSNSNAVAEYTVGMMFDAARHLSVNTAEVKNGGWSKPTGVELTGKTISIMGFGNIGQQVARMAHGLGMRVLAYDAFPVSPAVLEKYEAQQVDLDTACRNGDFITIHVPLLDSTRNMISSGQFEIMKPNAIVINAARGGIVDEKAQYEALKNQKIAAAVSDVFTVEPPVQEGWVKELLRMDNYIQTAHIASRSKEAEINTVNMATENILKLLNE